MATVTPYLQALDTLEKAASLARMTKADHMEAQKAAEIIREAIKASGQEASKKKSSEPSEK